MKLRLNRAISLAFICILAIRSIALAADISVSLENPPSTGVVEFILYDSANSFGDSRDETYSVRFPVNADNIYRIKALTSGEYALIVYFDENDNSLMDRNFIGIPKEPIGYANGYRPKGPPSFSKAAFSLEDGKDRHFDVMIERPLGEFGRIGVGLAIISRSSPYRDYKGDVSQAIPAITYMGERLQIYGPDMQLGIAGNDKLRLAATGRYRMAVYDEEDSDFLAGMGTPDDTFMAGLAVVGELPGGVNISAGYSHDVLDYIGGGVARVELGKSFQFGDLRFSPQISVNRLSAELSNNDYGVPVGSATAERPAYELDATISMEGGVSMFLEFKRGWLVVINAGVEFLDEDVTDSPIVSEDYVVKGLGIISYLF